MPVSTPNLSDFFNLAPQTPPETEEERRRRLLLELGLLPGTEVPPEASALEPAVVPESDFTTLDTGEIPLPPTPFQRPLEDIAQPSGDYLSRPPDPRTFPQRAAQQSLDVLSPSISIAEAALGRRQPTPEEEAQGLAEGRPYPFNLVGEGRGLESNQDIAGLPGTGSLMNFLDAMPQSLGPIAVPVAGAARIPLTIGANLFGEAITAGDVLASGGRALGRTAGRLGQGLGNLEAGVARDLGLLTEPQLTRAAARKPRPQPTPEGPLPPPRSPINPLEAGAETVPPPRRLSPEDLAGLSEDVSRQMPTGERAPRGSTGSTPEELRASQAAEEATTEAPRPPLDAESYWNTNRDFRQTFIREHPEMDIPYLTAGRMPKQTWARVKPLVEAVIQREPEALARGVPTQAAPTNPLEELIASMETPRVFQRNFKDPTYLVHLSPDDAADLYVQADKAAYKQGNIRYPSGREVEQRRDAKNIHSATIRRVLTSNDPSDLALAAQVTSKTLGNNDFLKTLWRRSQGLEKGEIPDGPPRRITPEQAAADAEIEAETRGPLRVTAPEGSIGQRVSGVTPPRKGVRTTPERISATTPTADLEATLQALKPDAVIQPGVDTPKYRKSLQQAIARAQAEGRTPTPPRPEVPEATVPESAQRNQGSNRDRAIAFATSENAADKMLTMDTAEVQAIAQTLGVSGRGTKTELIPRIRQQAARLARESRVNAQVPTPRAPTEAAPTQETPHILDTTWDNMPVQARSGMATIAGQSGRTGSAAWSEIPENYKSGLRAAWDTLAKAAAESSQTAASRVAAEGEADVAAAGRLRREAGETAEASSTVTPTPTRTTREKRAPQAKASEPTTTKPPEPTPEPITETPTPPTRQSPLNRLRQAANTIEYEIGGGVGEKPLRYRPRKAGSRWVNAKGVDRASQRKDIEAALKKLGADFTTVGEPPSKAAREAGGKTLWSVTQASDALPEGYTIKASGSTKDATRTVTLHGPDGKPIGTPYTYTKGEGYEPAYKALSAQVPKGSAKAAPSPTATGPTPPTPSQPSNLKSMKYPELKTTAESLGIATEGKTRAQLREEVAGVQGIDLHAKPVKPTTPTTPPTTPGAFTYPTGITADLVDTTKPVTRTIIRDNGKVVLGPDFKPEDLKVGHWENNAFVSGKSKGQQPALSYRGITGTGRNMREAFEDLVTNHASQPEVTVVRNAQREASTTHASHPPTVSPATTTPPTPSPRGRRLTRPEVLTHLGNNPAYADLTFTLDKKNKAGNYTASIKVKGDTTNATKVEIIPAANPTQAMERLEELAAAKRADGTFGPPPSTPPPAPPSTPPPGHPGGPQPTWSDMVRKLAVSLRENLKGLPELKTEQKAERGARFAAARRELGAYTDPEKAFQMSRRKLAGELKKSTTDFTPLDLTNEEVNTIRSYIQSKAVISQEHAVADILLTSAVNAENAITKLTKGYMIGDYETKLLTRFFGPELEEILTSYHLTPGQRFRNAGLALVKDFSRHIVSAGDFSFMFLQGFMTNASHPKIAARAYKDMFKVAASETKRSGKKIAKLGGREFKPVDDITYTHTIHSRITEDPYYSLHVESGGRYINPFGYGSEFGDEQIAANSMIARVLEEIPFVSPTQRAYVSVGNDIRFQRFKQMAEHLEAHKVYYSGQPHLDEQGIAYTINPKAYTDFQRFNNASTGQGHIAGRELNNLLSTVFFAPKYFMSHLETLGLGIEAMAASPGVRKVTKSKLDPTVRNEILRSMASTVLTYGAIVGGLAATGYATVESDWRSGDYGKIKVGNWHYDPWGGYQQILRAAAQLYTGEATAMDTDEMRKVGAGETLWRFARSKFNIPLAVGIDVYTGETYTGKKLDGYAEALGMKIPTDVLAHIGSQTMIFFSLRDFLQVMQETDAINAIKGLPGALGMNSSYISSDTDKIPGLHMYKTAEVFAADLIEERMGVPGLSKKILAWQRETNTDKKQDLAEEIDNAYNPPEGSTFLNIVSGKETLYGYLVRGVQNKAMAGSPELQTHLAATGQRDIPDFEKPEVPREVPEPKRAPAPQNPNLDPWSEAYVKDWLAATYGPKWGFTNPHDDKPVAYNQLDATARRSLDAYTSKLNEKTVELRGKLGDKSWGALSKSQKSTILKAVGVGPRKPVVKKTETQLREEELEGMTSQIPTDLEEQRRRTKGR